MFLGAITNSNPSVARYWSLLHFKQRHRAYFDTKIIIAEDGDQANNLWIGILILYQHRYFQYSMKSCEDHNKQTVL